ncbi:hypothetical protein [Enterococcus gallinarum]
MLWLTAFRNGKPFIGYPMELSQSKMPAPLMNTKTTLAKSLATI